MSTAKRVIKNTGFLYAKMGITMFISLYSTRLILNALGTSDFGIFNIVGGAIAMLGFLNAAMASATQRFMSYSEGQGDNEKKKKIFNISVVLHFLIAIIVGLVLISAGLIFFNGVLNIESNRIFAAKVVYGSLIISTIFTVMTVPYDAVLNAHENMLYYAIVGIIESLLKLIISLVIVYVGGDKLILYGILIAGIPIITMTIMQIYCHYHYNECVLAPKQYWDKSLVNEMASFAGWSLIGAASGMISQYGLSIILNVFFGTILNAAQGIANQISGLLMTFSNTMMKAVNPVIAKSEAGGDRNLMINTALSGTKYSFFLFALFAVPFIIETPFILHIWLKKVPDWAVLFTRLQLIRTLIGQLTSMIGATILAVGRIGSFTKVTFVCNIMPILLTFIFFSLGFPSYYLYITWIFMGAITVGVTVYFSNKKCGLQYNDFFKIVFYPCICNCLFLLIGFLPLFLAPTSFIRLLIVISVVLLISILTFWFLFLTNEEKVFIRQIVKNLRTKIEYKGQFI